MIHDFFNKAINDFWFFLKLYFILVPCDVNPCTAANTGNCINNADSTRTCSCIPGYTETDGSNAENGCDCMYDSNQPSFTVLF